MPRRYYANPHSNNISSFISHADLDSSSSSLRTNKFKVTDNFISRLGFIGELDGHSGCVNCLEWSGDGRILASGSDDCLVNLWDPFRKKKLLSIPTGHQGNIFSVKFLPSSSSQTLVTGAADNGVRLLSSVTQECLSVCSCHTGRVKRLATDPVAPSLYWSAGEDGLILQHDTRASHTCRSETNKPKNVLVDLSWFVGAKAEAKAIAVNPVNSDLLAVGANDPFARLYDRRMIRVQNPEAELLVVPAPSPDQRDSPDVPSSSIQYFVPGHIPLKMGEYNKKYRSLSITYLTFSEDGTELLVNCGGEQIYLYSLRKDLQRDYKKLVIPETSPSPSSSSSSSSAPACTKNGYKNGVCSSSSSSSTSGKYTSSLVLPPSIDELKRRANEAFELKKFSQAIHLYNEALASVPYSAVLLGNRASALLHRKWDGDVYAAVQDCYDALKFDPAYHKLYLRLCRALLELYRTADAQEIFNEFKKRFPDLSNSRDTRKVLEEIEKVREKEIERAARRERLQQSKKNAGQPLVPAPGEFSFSANPAPGAGRPEPEPLPAASSAATLSRSFFLRFTNSSDSSNSSHGPEGQEGTGTGSNRNHGDPDNEPESPDEDEDEDLDDTDSPNNSNSSRRRSLTKKAPRLRNLEDEKKKGARDFRKRYCGHSNCTTDIKECNFFGNCIVAGSDDGNFVFWDRKTTNIVRVLAGDESIVNCVQSHPTQCLLATSGIEQVVRLWGPLPEIPNSENDRLVTTDWNEVASENQKRMQSNPFEVILMNMGYRLDEEDDSVDEPRGVQCNQT